jgi:hypothetical protein
MQGYPKGLTLFYFFYYWWGGTYVTRYCGHFWPIVQPQMIDEGYCGANGGMKIGRGNRSTRRKPAPAPFCPPQIPLDQTRARTRAAAVGSQRLTAWAMARPKVLLSLRKWYSQLGIFVVEGCNKVSSQSSSGTYVYRYLFSTWTELRGRLSARELYRTSDRRMSAKLVPTFADRGCRVVSATDPYSR